MYGNCMKSCPECSPTHQLDHRKEWAMNVVDDVMNSFSRRLSFPLLESMVQRVAIGALLGSFRLIGLIKSKPVTEDSHVHQRTKVIAEEAEKRGWKVMMLSFLGHDSNLFFVDGAGKSDVFEGLPGLDPAKTITKVDDKEWVKHLLRSLECPTPEGQAFTNVMKALRYGEQLGFPLVVKPRTGSLSAHTTVNIQSMDELERAVLVAKHVSPSFMVEQYVPGNLYRATTVGTSLVAVGRRDPPCIIGDGVQTAGELITAREAEQRELLVALGYKPEEVPGLPRNHMKKDPSEILPLGERVAVTWKINLSYGATVTDVTDRVHPDNIELFEGVAKAAKLPSLGIDFLAPDIAVSYKEQRCGVIELNSLPSIDLHHPPIVIGTFRNVAAALLDHVYGSKLDESRT